MKPWAVAVALVAIVAASVPHSSRSSPMDDPSKLPPRTLQISLGQTVREFMQTNGLPAENGRSSTPDHNNYGVALDVIADTSPILFGDHWIALVVKAGPAVFALPAGRTLVVDQVAGRIHGFSFTPFAQAQPLAETNRQVKVLTDQFLAKGWTPRVANSLTFALTDDDADFKRSGAKIYAQLANGDGDLLSVTVTNLESVPGQPAYILAPSPGRPRHSPPVYVVRLGFFWAHRNDTSYGDLIYPRRMLVNGNKDQLLRLRPWVEDPDWTPEKHGMVDEGGTGESRRWHLPAK